MRKFDASDPDHAIHSEPEWWALPRHIVASERRRARLEYSLLKSGSGFHDREKCTIALTGRQTIVTLRYFLWQPSQDGIAACAQTAEWPELIKEEHRDNGKVVLDYSERIIPQTGKSPRRHRQIYRLPKPQIEGGGWIIYSQQSSAEEIRSHIHFENSRGYQISWPRWQTIDSPRSRGQAPEDFIEESLKNREKMRTLSQYAQAVRLKASTGKITVLREIWALRSEPLAWSLLSTRELLHSPQEVALRRTATPRLPPGFNR